MAQKVALGKGLASLLPGVSGGINAGGTDGAASNHSVPGAIPDTAHEAALGSTPVEGGSNRDRHPGISILPIDELRENSYQPRRSFDDAAIRELSQSIQANGIIQPLIVRKTPDGYELIAGERRLRAAKLAGVKSVPVVIRRSTDREALELALVENIQRQDLNCVDEALAYFQLIEDFSLTQEEVAARVGKERATVANFLRLLRLPEEILEDLKRGDLSFGHGRALLGLDEREKRIELRNQVLENKLSVRETEALVERAKAQALAMEQGLVDSPNDSPQAPNPIQLRLGHLGKELGRNLYTRVEVRGNEKKGKIVIHYGNPQELERLIDSLQAPTRTSMLSAEAPSSSLSAN